MLSSNTEIKEMLCPLKNKCEVHLVRISPDQIKRLTSKCIVKRKRKSSNGKWEPYSKYDQNSLEGRDVQEISKRMRRGRQARNCVKTNYHDRFEKLRSAREKKKSVLNNSKDSLHTRSVSNDSDYSIDSCENSDDDSNEGMDSSPVRCSKIDNRNSFLCTKSINSNNSFDKTVDCPPADDVGVRKIKSQINQTNGVIASEGSSSHLQFKNRTLLSSEVHVKVDTKDYVTLQRKKTDMTHNKHHISPINSPRKVVENRKSACLDTNANISFINYMNESAGKIDNTISTKKEDAVAAISSDNTKKLEGKEKFKKKNFFLLKKSKRKKLKDADGSVNSNVKNFEERIPAFVVSESNGRHTVNGHEQSLKNIKCRSKSLEFDSSSIDINNSIGTDDSGDLRKIHDKSSMKRSFSSDSNEKLKRMETVEEKSKIIKRMPAARNRSASLGSHKNYVDRPEVNRKCREYNKEAGESVNYKVDENMSVFKESDEYYGTGKAIRSSNNKIDMKKYPLKGILKNSLNETVLISSQSMQPLNEKYPGTKPQPSGNFMYYEDYLKSLEEEQTTVDQVSIKKEVAPENQKITDIIPESNEERETVLDLQNYIADKTFNTKDYTEDSSIEISLESKDKSSLQASRYQNVSVSAAMEENSTKPENDAYSLESAGRKIYENKYSVNKESKKHDTKCKDIEQKKCKNKRVNLEKLCKSKKLKQRNRKSIISNEVFTRRVKDKCTLLFGSSLSDIPSASSDSSENNFDTISINSSVLPDSMTQELSFHITENKLPHCAVNASEVVANSVETFDSIDSYAEICSTEVTGDIKNENSRCDKLNSSQESAIATENLIRELEGSLLDTFLCENESSQMRINVNSNENINITPDEKSTTKYTTREITQPVNRAPNDISVRTAGINCKGSELTNTNCANNEQYLVKHTSLDSNEQPSIPEISLPETARLSANYMEILNVFDDATKKSKILPQEAVPSESTLSSIEKQSIRLDSDNTTTNSFPLNYLLDKKINECNKIKMLKENSFKRIQLKGPECLASAEQTSNDLQKDNMPDLDTADKAVKSSRANADCGNKNNCTQNKNSIEVTSNINEAVCKRTGDTTQPVENFGNFCPPLKRETVDEAYSVGTDSSYEKELDTLLDQNPDLSGTTSQVNKTQKSLLQATPSSTTQDHVQVKVEHSEINGSLAFSQSSGHNESITQNNVSYNKGSPRNKPDTDISNIKCSPSSYLAERDQISSSTSSSKSVIKNNNSSNTTETLPPVPSLSDSMITIAGGSDATSPDPSLSDPVITNTNSSNPHEILNSPVSVVKNIDSSNVYKTPAQSIIGKIRVRPPESLGLSINSNLDIGNTALPEKSRTVCEVAREVLETLLVSFLDLDTYWERVAKAKNMTCIREKEMDFAFRTLVDSWELRSHIMLQYLNYYTYDDNFYNTVLDYIKVNYQKPNKEKTLDDVKVLIKSILSVFDVKGSTSSNLQDAEQSQENTNLLLRKECFMKSLVDIKVYDFLDSYLKEKVLSSYATSLQPCLPNSNENYKSQDNITTLHSDDPPVSTNVIPISQNNQRPEINSNDKQRSSCRNECENTTSTTDLVIRNYTQNQESRNPDTAHNNSLSAAQTVTQNICQESNAHNQKQNFDVQQQSISQNMCYQMVSKNLQAQNIQQNMAMTSALLQRDLRSLQRQTSNSCETRASQSIPTPSRYKRSNSDSQTSYQHQTKIATNLQPLISNQFLSSNINTLQSQTSNQIQILQNLQPSNSNQYNNFQRCVDQQSQSANTATQSAKTNNMVKALSIQAQNRQMVLNSCTLPASNMLNSFSRTQYVSSMQGIGFNSDRTQVSSANNSYTLPPTATNVINAHAQIRRDQIENYISVLPQNASSYQGNFQQFPTSQQLTTLRQQSSITNVPNAVHQNENQNLTTTCRINQNMMNLLNQSSRSQPNCTTSNQNQRANNSVESCFRSSDTQTTNLRNLFDQQVGRYCTVSSDQRVGNLRTSSDQQVVNPGTSSDQRLVNSRTSINQRISGYHRTPPNQQTINNFRTDFPQTDLLSCLLNPQTSTNEATDTLSGFIPYTAANNAVSPVDQTSAFNSGVRSGFHFSSAASNETVPYHRRAVPNSLSNSGSNFSPTNLPQEAVFNSQQIQQCSVDNSRFAQNNMNVSLSVQSTYVQAAVSNNNSWGPRNSEENVMPQSNRTFPPNYTPENISNNFQTQQSVWPAVTGMPGYDQQIEQPVATDPAFHGVQPQLRSVSRDSGYTTPSPVVPLPSVREQDDMGPVDVGTFCNVCFKPAGFTCFNCSQVNYCSKVCQENDWTYHQPVCSKSLSTENDLQL